jgi:predicted nucleic acid-binding protein
MIFDVAADIMAARQTQGRSGEVRDSIIAGIALASRATLATRKSGTSMTSPYRSTGQEA